MGIFLTVDSIPRFLLIPACRQIQTCPAIPEGFFPKNRPVGPYPIRHLSDLEDRLIVRCLVVPCWVRFGFCLADQRRES